MKIIADLHIHSRYSRATSKKLDFEHLSQWAQMKGVTLLGTGDISHPAWLEEMRQTLQPAEAGLFKLKDEIARAVQSRVPVASQGAVRFMLAGEISGIYKKNGRVRKVHNVIFAPSLEDAAKIQAALEKIGNIRSDGRPILGLDSRDLLEIILEINPQNHLIPAHIWTPWFSMLGSKSGFDTVEECFEDLTPHIFALETGLSSDPPMNWRVSNLDRYTLVSNSDAHSPQKLAREANIFDTDPSYSAIFEALQSGAPANFKGTLEFFPEEGKYHLDGHRKCKLRWTPAETLAHNGLCAVCGKPVTVGVMHRVETLADRPAGGKPARVHPFQSLIPLPELLSEVHGVGPNSKRVQKHYQDLLTRLGSELFILLDAPLEDIQKAGGALLAEGIRRMRARQVILAPGYDGEFGVVKVFDEGERRALSGQVGFQGSGFEFRVSSSGFRVSSSEIQQPENQNPKPETRNQKPETKNPKPETLSPEQEAAVHAAGESLIIVAGPGAGKTRALTHRIAHLIQAKNVAPESVLAITFTNKAAAEMAERLSALLGQKIAAQLNVKTFHAFGAMVLRADGERIGLSPDFAILDQADCLLLLKEACPHLSQREAVERMNEWANGAPQRAKDKGQGTRDCLEAYQNALR
ncbi:MAG TPA: AAA family ATPase, partial [Anaerolineae bacterium]|nr:AAA family ATPase [Anaerolineae bacterium]